MRSIGSVIEANKGLGPGFDFLRVALALSVVFVHAETVATGKNYESSRIMWMPEYAILVMFFALSGFLITGSAQRLSLKNFMINRGMRIFPALAIEVALSAFVLGAVFTDLPVSDYFSRLQTYHYMTNIIGWINYQLPGVFTHNPKSAINWSLWTVPYELGCYFIMGVLMTFKVLPKRIILPCIVAFFLALGFIVPAFMIEPHQTDIVARILSPVFVDQGSKLYVSFLLGIAAYLYRDRLPYDRRIFAACVVYCIGLSLFRPAPWLSTSILNLTVAPVAVYITIFIGATRIPKLPIYGHGDYSYGIYLYGNPIQQAVRAALPWTDTAFLNLLIAIPIISLFAMFSWHLPEKWVLRQRKRFSFVARVRGVEDAPKGHPQDINTAPAQPIA